MSGRDKGIFGAMHCLGSYDFEGNVILDEHV